MSVCSFGAIGGDFGKLWLSEFLPVRRGRRQETYPTHHHAKINKFPLCQHIAIKPCQHTGRWIFLPMNAISGPWTYFCGTEERILEVKSTVHKLKRFVWNSTGTYKTSMGSTYLCIVPPPGGEDFCHVGAATKPKSQWSKSQLCSEQTVWVYELLIWPQEVFLQFHRNMFRDPK